MKRNRLNLTRVLVGLLSLIVSTAVCSQAQPLTPGLTLHINQLRFGPGETLLISLDLYNPGPPLTTDMYLGLLLPDGQSVFWVTSLSPLNGSLTMINSDPSTFPPLFRSISFMAGLDVLRQAFWAYTFNGTEPLGTYHVFVAWTIPESLSDRAIDAGDVIAFDWSPFSVSTERSGFQ